MAIDFTLTKEQQELQAMAVAFDEVEAHDDVWVVLEE